MFKFIILNRNWIWFLNKFEAFAILSSFLIAVSNNLFGRFNLQLNKDDFKAILEANQCELDNFTLK